MGPTSPPSALLDLSRSSAADAARGEGGRLEGRAGLGLRSGQRAEGRLRGRAEPLDGLAARLEGQDCLVGALQGREIAAAGKLLAGELDGPLLLPHQPVDRRPQCEHEGAAQDEQLGAGAEVFEHGVRGQGVRGLGG